MYASFLVRRKTAIRRGVFLKSQENVIARLVYVTRSMGTISNIYKCVHENSLHFIISGSSEGDKKRKLILPSSLVNAEKEQVNLVDNSAITSITTVIEKYYSLDTSDHFVGGMGESDGGVWLASETLSGIDTLDFMEEISEISRKIKQSRHGIKFGVYTSGLVNDATICENLANLGISMMKVSLLASNPVAYGKLTGVNSSDSSKAFGQVCGFIALASESGFKVTAAVGSSDKSAASELAKALGAVDVAVYNI